MIWLVVFLQCVPRQLFITLISCSRCLADGLVVVGYLLVAGVPHSRVRKALDRLAMPNCWFGSAVFFSHKVTCACWIMHSVPLCDRRSSRLSLRLTSSPCPTHALLRMWWRHAGVRVCLGGDGCQKEARREITEVAWVVWLQTCTHAGAAHRVMLACIRGSTSVMYMALFQPASYC
jgi:hypothetical protein